MAAATAKTEEEEQEEESRDIANKTNQQTKSGEKESMTRKLFLACCWDSRK